MEADDAAELERLKRTKGHVGREGSGSRTIAQGGATIVSNSRQIVSDAWRLAPDLVPLASARGQQLLAEAECRAAFDRLWPHFAPQAGSSCCGVCSAAMVASALACRRITEDDFFGRLPADLALGGRPAEIAVRSAGVTLEQLAELIRAAPGIAAAERPFEGGFVHGDAIDVAGARAALRAALLSVGDSGAGAPTYPLLNYQMSELGQEPWGGHVSPIAAYHAGADAFLLLDVWFHTEPVWASAARVHAAMSGSDDSVSGKKRGLAFVAAGGGGSGGRL